MSTPLTVCTGYDDVPGDLQLEHFSLDAEPPQKLSLIQRATAMSERKISMLEPGAGPKPMLRRRPPSPPHTLLATGACALRRHTRRSDRGGALQENTHTRCAMCDALFLVLLVHKHAPSSRLTFFPRPCGPAVAQVCLAVGAARLGPSSFKNPRLGLCGAHSYRRW